ncbi:hemerythrin domain-containing protein [Actinocrispum sp. NPDC049592]|uniref:hemerythrin domain-containing protein n=1 Tax=Actinocrispum sp. NPDC049592 TaxID=3154835 RepID=UPI0034407626
MTANEQILSSENGVQGLPEHIRAFALMHVAMRRDAKRLAAAAPHVTRSTASDVGAWFKELFDIIDWHHRTEDEVLFPDVRRAVPSFAAKEKALSHDHEALDQAMAEVAAALSPGGDLAKLPAAAEKFKTILFEHLRLEETVVFPVFVNDLTVRQYVSIENRSVSSAPMSLRSFLYPWMYDGVDCRTASRVAAAATPLPFRLVGDTVLKMRYQRAIATVVRLASR